MQYSADRYILAVGTRPYRPAHVPFDGDCVLDSDEILDLKRLPRHLVVVGAGVIGVEYATIFSALDVRVTLIEARTSMLEFIDRELLATFIYDIRDRGIALRLGCTVKDHREERHHLHDPARGWPHGALGHGAVRGGPDGGHRRI